MCPESSAASTEVYPSGEWIAAHAAGSSPSAVSEVAEVEDYQSMMDGQLGWETGWRLEDEGPNFTYDFPDGFTLAPGVTVRVRVGVGTDTATTLYWGLEEAPYGTTAETPHHCSTPATP